MSDPTALEIDFDPTVQRMRGITVHGHMPFDVPLISEIDHNLWQGGCEQGLILPRFIKHLVSLYPWERFTVRHELDSVLVPGCTTARTRHLNKLRRSPAG